MKSAHVDAVQNSWAQLVPLANQVGELFYTNLFAQDPSARLLFQGDMDAQGKRLMDMISSAVGNLDNPALLLPALQSLGRRHMAYGVTPRHFDTMGRALLQTLAQGLGTAYTPEVNEAWTSVYGSLRSTMLLAANEAEA
jgi:methyl-accepting chemotaxis protein